MHGEEVPRQRGLRGEPGRAIDRLPAAGRDRTSGARVIKIRQSLETARAVARNLVLGGNLASLSLVARPRALLAYTTECLFLLKAMAGRRGVRSGSVFQVLGGSPSTDITIANLEAETWLRPVASYTADLVSLCLICRALQPRRVFEIGTLQGYTALHFALNTPPDAVIHTLDLPQATPAAPALQTTIMDDAHIRSGTRATRRVFEGTPVAGKIVPLFGDSATFDFSPFHGRVDFFFIDGAHSYDYVASDTRRAFDCVRAGGVIAWHDFGRVGVNGVTRLVGEVARAREVHAIPGGSLAFTVV
jgi:predicted O-methyltransferase YrrM